MKKTNESIGFIALFFVLSFRQTTLELEDVKQEV